MNIEDLLGMGTNQPSAPSQGQGLGGLGDLDLGGVAQQAKQ